jgi:hypothetical protein
MLADRLNNCEPETFWSIFGELDLVPDHQHSVRAGRALVPRRAGALLPRVEVCGGISEPRIGNRVKGSFSVVPARERCGRAKFDLSMNCAVELSERTQLS